MSTFVYSEKLHVMTMHVNMWDQQDFIKLRVNRKGHSKQNLHFPKREKAKGVWNKRINDYKQTANSCLCEAIFSISTLNNSGELSTIYTLAKYKP